MKKLYCTICDYCRIIIAYDEGQPTGQWIKDEQGHDYCSDECKEMADKEK